MRERGIHNNLAPGHLDQWHNEHAIRFRQDDNSSCIINCHLEIQSNYVKSMTSLWSKAVHEGPLCIHSKVQVTVFVSVYCFTAVGNWSGAMTWTLMGRCQNPARVLILLKDHVLSCSNLTSIRKRNFSMYCAYCTLSILYTVQYNVQCRGLQWQAGV